MLQNMWWSLKLRMYARRSVACLPASAPPQIRIFVLYHDPSFTQSVPHSVGMQKGLVGVVHAFAEREMTRPTTWSSRTRSCTRSAPPTNTIRKRWRRCFRSVTPNRNASRCYPQTLTEIMAGRSRVDAQHFEMPESLAEVVVGAATRARNPLAAPVSARCSKPRSCASRCRAECSSTI